jgi:SAM-dependent methyltransferase
MILTQDVKDKITKEFEDFKTNMYAGKTKEERQQLGQFFTPPDISIRMIERFEVESLSGQRILDPACGSGNLLAACLYAGADSTKLFGNELDKTMLDTCRKRLNKICRELNKPEIPYHHLHIGDATVPRCLTVFSSAYDWKPPAERTEADENQEKVYACKETLDSLTAAFYKLFGDQDI